MGEKRWMSCAWSRWKTTSCLAFTTEKRLQRDGVEQEDFWGERWGFCGQEMGRAFIAARAPFSGGVVPELVGGGFGEEVGATVEGLSVVEFGFDGVVDAFDIGVGVGAGRWVKAMLGPIALLDGEVKTFGAVVSGRRGG